MEWYLNSPDINLEENLWYIKEMDMKMGYTIQRSLETIKTAASNVQVETVEKLTK